MRDEGVSYEEELYREHDRAVKRQRIEVHLRALLRHARKALLEITKATGEQQTRRIAEAALKRTDDAR